MYKKNIVQFPWLNYKDNYEQTNLPSPPRRAGHLLDTTSDTRFVTLLIQFTCPALNLLNPIPPSLLCFGSIHSPSPFFPKPPFVPSLFPKIQGTSQIFLFPHPFCAVILPLSAASFTLILHIGRTMHQRIFDGGRDEGTKNGGRGGGDGKIFASQLYESVCQCLVPFVIDGVADFETAWPER